MGNHVVISTCQALAGAGIMALRFNFRGTGRSGGTHTGGAREWEDIVAAAEKAKELLGKETTAVGLAGYSFGAAVAVMAAPHVPGLKAVALISPPTRALNKETIAALRVPVLIISGEQDIFAPPDELRQWERQMPEQVELVLMPGTDHFWGMGFDVPAARLAAFMRRHLEGHARP